MLIPFVIFNKTYNLLQSHSIFLLSVRINRNNNSEMKLSKRVLFHRQISVYKNIIFFCR